MASAGTGTGTKRKRSHVDVAYEKDDGPETTSSTLTSSGLVAEPIQSTSTPTKPVKVKVESNSIPITTPTKGKAKATPPNPPTPRPPPPNFEKTWNIISKFRKENEAAVDTMGCERLAETDKGDKAFHFQTLVALMLSSQTKDPVTASTMRNLQSHFNSQSRPFDVDAVLSISERELDGLISKVGFHNRKAGYIKEAAERLKREYDGDVPCDLEVVLSLKGVGPKMAHLFLQSAYSHSLGIGVDTHVHRISRRLNWTSPQSTTPELTRLELESWVPKDKWAALNPLLVGFGQTICKPVGPRCGGCPVNEEGLCPVGKRGMPLVSRNAKKVKEEGKGEVEVKVKEEDE